MRRGKTPKHYTACLKLKFWVVKLDSERNTGAQDEKSKIYRQGRQKTTGDIDITGKEKNQPWKLERKGERPQPLSF